MSALRPTPPPTRPQSSLRSEARHARAMSEAEYISDADRALWRQLAEELEHRLGVSAPGDEQATLW